MTCVMFFQIVLICLSVCLSSQLTWLNSKSKFCLLWGGQWLKSLFLYFSFSVAAWNLPHACVLHMSQPKIWVNFVCRNWNFPLLFSLLSKIPPIKLQLLWWNQCLCSDFSITKWLVPICVWIALQVIDYGLPLVEKNRKLTPCYFLFPSMASPSVS